jgi:hypothetical protein
MIGFVEIIPILRIYNAILFSRQLPDDYSASGGVIPPQAKGLL